MNILKSKMTLGTLLAILIFIYGSLFASWILKGKVKAEISSIISNGEPTTLAEFNSPVTIPSENAAILYSAAIELVETFDIEFSFSEDIYYFYQKHKDEIANILDKNSIALNLLLAASKKNQCNYNLRYEDGYKMKVLDYKNIRRLVWLSALKAYYEIEKGETKKAINTLFSAIKFIKTLQPEGLTIYHVIKRVCLNHLIEPLRTLTNKVHNNKELLPLKNEIKIITESGEKELLNVLYGERAFGIRMFEEIQTSKLSIKEFTGGSNDWLSSFISFVEMSLPGKPLLLYDELYYIRLQKNIITAFKNDEEQPLVLYQSIPRTCVFTTTILVNYNRLIEHDKQMRKEYKKIISMEGIHDSSTKIRQ